MILKKFLLHLYSLNIKRTHSNMFIIHWALWMCFFINVPLLITYQLRKTPSVPLYPVGFLGNLAYGFNVYGICNKNTYLGYSDDFHIILNQIVLSFLLPFVMIIISFDIYTQIHSEFRLPLIRIYQYFVHEEN